MQWIAPISRCTMLTTSHSAMAGTIHCMRIPPGIVAKVLYLRSRYHLGSIRIVWYLARYHDITISDAGVTRIWRRNGVGQLPRGTPQLNRKVERSHRSDQQESCQLLFCKGDVDLEAKLSEWENC